MQTLYFATTNKDKLLIAQTVCQSAGITVEQVQLEIDEIQGEDAELIVRDKALRAFAVLQKPVLVSDDSWEIPALNGFPGPYMKSINNWFTPADFIRLMHGVEDRTIILHQYLAYANGESVTVFTSDIPGKLVAEARGNYGKSPSLAVTVFDFDNGKTIAEVFKTGGSALTDRHKTRQDAWREFVDWYAAKPTTA